MAPHHEPPSTLLPAQKFDAPWPRYMHPYACFECRKSFKRLGVTEPVLPCPHCGGPSVGLTRKFKPPKQSDVKQWRKVEALVRHGFLFWDLGEPYPSDLTGVDGFAAKHAEHLREQRYRFSNAFEKIDAAMAKRSQSA
ncbi:hypothetical protein [Rhizobium herbae]